MIEVTPAIEALTAATPPLEVGVAPPSAKKLRNDRWAAKKKAQGALSTTIILTPAKREAIATLREWWPGIVSDQHAIEFALRWAAQASIAGVITRVQL